MTTFSTSGQTLSLDLHIFVVSQYYILHYAKVTTFNQILLKMQTSVQVIDV